MAAFLSVYSIMYNNYLFGSFREGIEENFDADFQVRHFTEQWFTGFDIKEFEELFSEKPVKRESCWELRRTCYIYAENGRL